MAITDPLVLPADVLLEPVSRLSDDARRRIDCDDADFAISRPRTRVTTRIIDRHAAALVSRFRRASTIAEAVLAQSRDQQLDPAQYLEDAIPLIERMIVDGLLVPADSPEAKTIVASLAADAVVGGATVGACLQQLADSEVYQARLTSGRWAALKIARADSERVRAQLDREARVLGRLGGDFTPELLAHAEHEGRPFLLIGWCAGVSATAAADDLRDPRTGDRTRLLRLCSTIARAYARLHERGVIHSDVHPRNIVVDADGVVRLIDFGLARVLDDDGALPGRAGVGWYFEPEFASARLAGRRAPASTPAGEQYALAALLYQLVTGDAYLDFALDRSRALKQIAEEPPLPFARRGADPWPDVERVLGRALRKSPGERFGSVGDLANALDACAVPAARAETPSERTAASPALRSPLEQWFARVTPGGSLFEAGITAEPTASVNNGAAGVACALYRIALGRDDAELLSAADIWASRALAAIESPTAFYAGASVRTPASSRNAALYHSATGVRCVRALVSLALADNVTAQAAIDALAAAIDACPDRELDLATGRTGLLLGASLLLDAMPESPYLDPAALRRAGDGLARETWERVSGLPAVSRCDAMPMTGIAHGWGGVLYALIRWARSTGTPLPDGVEARLEELAACGEQAGRGLRWPRVLHQRLGDESVDYVPGWCNGSAGLVHLWTLAHATLREARWLELAERAGWHVWEDMTYPGMFDLCCGAGGRAYALLALHRSTGEAAWLRRAESLAGRAAANVLADPATDHALYKGALGIALLAAELDWPRAARMPLFEHEGWPEGAS